VGLFPLLHSFNLCGIYNDSLSSENMTKEGNFLEPKVTFAELGIQLILPQLLQNHSQVLLMLFGGGRIDKDVINEHYHKLVQFIHEYLIHHVHEISRALVSLKDTTVNSYCPYLVTKAILGMSSGMIFI
jgi:hypothetical protein